MVSKRGVSNLIGYVLLIALVITIGIITYNTMKTYLPHETITCPSEVSLVIKNYTCSTSELKLVIKNDGMFSVGGYFIYATNKEDVELATIDISKNITSGETPLNPTGIKLSGEGNSLLPNYEETHTFNVTSVTPRIYSIEIVPLRWKEQGRKKVLATCVDSKLRQAIECI